MWFQSESTGLRSRRADGVGSSESQQAQNPRANVSVQVQMLEMMNVLSSSPAGRVPSYSAFLFYLGLQLIGLEAPILEKAVFFTQPTYSKVDLIQKHPLRHTQNNV